MTRAKFTALRFLVVDDSATYRNLVVKALTDAGVTLIEQAGDGMDAWSILEHCSFAEQPVDFIISDWNMPRLSGLDLLKRCRKHREFKKAGFLLVTTVIDATKVQAAIDAGVDDYLVKPFQDTALRGKVARIVEKRSK